MKKNIKQTCLVIALALVFATGSSAQEIAANDSISQTESDEVVGEPDWSGLLPLSVTPDKEGYENMSIGLTKNYVKKYIEHLKKYGKKAKEWTETAKREKVKNFEKSLTKTLSVANVPVRYISFTVDGVSLQRFYYNSLMSFTNLYMCPYFKVDADGNCFLRMSSSTLGTFRITSGKTVESTATAGTGLLGPRVVGHSTSKEVTTYEPGGFSIYIPTSEIDAYIKMLEDGLKHFEAKKAESKLFK